MLTPLAAGDPRRIGPFEIHNRIGAGGMGSVYLGFTAEGRAAAVKVPAEGLAGDPEFRARFRREVEAARRVRGRAVAAVVDADPDATSPWMAVEYVEGTSLADAVIRHGPLEQRLLHGFGVGLADALVAIHAVGVVHRDLKPSNILLAWDGPKVIDFGIARASGTPTHTRTGILVGTPAWMAPEQLRGERATPAADVFAWGACVTYAATGHPPFGGAEPADVLTVLRRDEQPDLDGVPPDLLAAVRAALARRPEARPSAAELVRTLVTEPGSRGGSPDPARAAANALTPWQWEPPASLAHHPAHSGRDERPAAERAERPDRGERPDRDERATQTARGERERGERGERGERAGRIAAAAGAVAGAANPGGPAAGIRRTATRGPGGPAGGQGDGPAKFRAVDRPTQPLATRADPGSWEEPPGGDSSLGTVPVPRLSALADNRNETTDPSIRPRRTATVASVSAFNAAEVTGPLLTAQAPAATGAGGTGTSTGSAAGGAGTRAGAGDQPTGRDREPDHPGGARAEPGAWPPDPRAWLSLLAASGRRDRAAMVAAVVAFGLVVGVVVLLTASDASRAESGPSRPSPGPSQRGVTATTPPATTSRPTVVAPTTVARTGRAEPGQGSAPPTQAGIPAGPEPTAGVRTDPSAQATPTHAVSPTGDASAPPTPDPSLSATPCAAGARPEGVVATATPEPC
ncbi:serine/threonine protein kinase [Parafrankia soli]|uniref:non-specific serine/threonine protein kinase n=1 Tax=Parafrankia soli TaxID=2599596 RepID=A0A1S1PJP6_9ACTN|nr:serine/threonine-protein kinase [Parafrankia soli]OHV20244.1 serine/threonine protein kinase [Parafrankia soli]